MHLGFQAGTVIGLPPIINFARPHLKKKIIEDAFAGKVVSPARLYITMVGN